ncbi:metal-dependent hydrolase [Actinomadura gamaensis]|uniref:Metal-dependent hydrolase n=1 Tax=Actinomadura gamaensis TaxID=1763541 RepID=A0ABV9TWM1_9ACTN
MGDIKESTAVTFPSGAVAGRSRVVAALPVDGGYGVIVAETPFHPLDNSWPDQPGDTGVIRWDELELRVADCVTGAVPLADGALPPEDALPSEGARPTDRQRHADRERHTDRARHTDRERHADRAPLTDRARHVGSGRRTGSARISGRSRLAGGTLLTGDDIPVRRGDPDWAWLVVHVLERRVPEDEVVELDVEPVRREALSAGHTACHLMALALNRALADRWRKEPPRTDSLGRPDFDQLAIAASRIVPHGSVDTYRIGRSLRKRGFVAEGLAGALGDVEAAVNEQLAAWIAADATVRLDVPSPELAARRLWRCDLPEGTASLPCGGTHLRATGELSRARVRLELSDTGDELVVETRAETA